MVLGQNVKLRQAFEQGFVQGMPHSHPQGLECSCLCTEDVSRGGGACSNSCESGVACATTAGVVVIGARGFSKCSGFALIGMLWGAKAFFDGR